MVAKFIGLFLLCYQLYHPAASWRCNNCEVQYKAKGCYHDNPSRVLKTQVINERDPTSNVFNGRRIEWTNWNNYMAEFACRCAKAVKERGWKIFGLQFYGECWSGPPNTYDESTFVSSDSCIAEDYQYCGGLDRHCIGKRWTNFVYELEPDCAEQFERIGCFRDNQIVPRPIPDYIMTDRQRNLAIYSGQSIDWRNWDVYMPQFVCRCAKEAKEKGYTLFGVQFYGECWSGVQSEKTYGNIGVSTNCLDKCYESCKPYEKFCAGKQFANAVYRLSGSSCEVSHTPIGCYNENPNDRAFFTELVNQVNPISEKFNGMIMEYGNGWSTEFTKFLCRCARQARLLKYNMFGVHKGGECWGAPNADQVFDKHGQASYDKCFYNFNQSCNVGMSACAGGNDTNFVFSVNDIASKRSLAGEEKVVDLSDDEEVPFDVLAETVTNPRKLKRVKERKSTGRKFKPFP